MANLLGQLSYRIIDSSGVIANKVIYFVFPDSKTLAQVETFAGLYAALLDAVTEGEVIKQVFRVILATSGLKSTPVTDSDVQETGLLDFALASSFYSYGDDIPALIDAAIVNGRIDLSNAALTNYYDFLITGDSGFLPSNQFAIDIAALNSGVETFRKKRKQLNARSREFLVEIS